MDRVYDKCCGIDVHKKLIVVCFKQGNRQEIRDFGATTRELLEMADWLKKGGCEMIAMESTSSYWKPLYNILEVCELNVIVVNARHMKAVPGRKTDVKDAEWIADLLQHGLLTASYIPGQGSEGTAGACALSQEPRWRTQSGTQPASEDAGRSQY